MNEPLDAQLEQVLGEGILPACLAAERTAGVPRGALLALAAHETSGSRLAGWLHDRMEGGTLSEAAAQAGGLLGGEELSTDLRAIQRWLDRRFGEPAHPRHPRLEPGVTGHAVVELKRLLRGWYASEGKPPPRRMRGPAYGSTAVEAVKEFQRANGLTPDGIVGDDTWRALLQRSAA